MTAVAACSTKRSFRPPARTRRCALEPRCDVGAARRATATRPASRTIRRSPTSCRDATARSRMLVLMRRGDDRRAGALHYFALPIAAFAGMPTLRPVRPGRSRQHRRLARRRGVVPGSVACLLIYSIRRHRIDDYRGRYRVWLGAALACLMLSANSVAGLHQVVADMLSHFTGGRRCATARCGGWRWPGCRSRGSRAVLLDMRECRLAAALLVCRGRVLCGERGQLSRLSCPTVEPQIAVARHRRDAAARSLAAVRGRRGVCPVRRARCPRAGHRSPTGRDQANVESDAKSEAPASRRRKPAASQRVRCSRPSAISRRHGSQPAKTPADSSRWVDGSRPERESLRRRRRR